MDLEKVDSQRMLQEALQKRLHKILGVPRSLSAPRHGHPPSALKYQVLHETDETPRTGSSARKFQEDPRSISWSPSSPQVCAFAHHCQDPLSADSAQAFLSAPSLDCKSVSVSSLAERPLAQQNDAQPTMTINNATKSPRTTIDYYRACWKRFAAPLFQADCYPASQQQERQHLDRLYRHLPEMFYTTSRLPCITPEFPRASSTT